eukprot:5680432-Ditylum_brightwellii.AAC.1
MFLKELYPTKEIMTAAWSKGLLSAIWGLFTKVWIAQRNTLYTKANMVTMLHLDQQIRYAFHTYSHSLFTSDQLLFSKGLKEQLSMTATAKQHWLEAVAIAAKDFLAVHKMSPAQQTITQFSLLLLLLHMQ